MRKLVVIMMAGILVFSLATPVFAQNLLVEAVGGVFRVAKKVVWDACVGGAAELVVSPIINLVKLKNGPIVSLGRGAVNGVGRFGGELINLVKDDAYTEELFENNPLAEQISIPPLIDWTATGAIAGPIGVVNNVWGGTAKGWTIAKSIVIGGTAGAITGAALQE